MPDRPRLAWSVLAEEPLVRPDALPIRPLC
jgi:hypothetical protein